MLGLRSLSIAAAVGLALFFAGARTHVRAHVFYNIAFPGSFLARAAGSAALALAGR